MASLPLFWRVFATNAAVLVIATATLALAPVTVSVPVALTELIVLLVGLVVMLAINLALLRRAFRPLGELAALMRRHDPLSPGGRVGVSGEPDVEALALAFNDMLDRLEHERRESGRRALLVQEAERRRVARELHDEVAQTLTGVMLQVEGLARAIPPELRGQLDDLREMARTGAEDVRRIARRLRPEALEDLGLHSALSALARGAGIPVERDLRPIRPLTDEQELVVYRVAQEALTNVIRHAGATRVWLTLEESAGRVVLRVRDDGSGLPPGALRSESGIRGMRERAMLIGAELAFDGPPGTEVRLTL